MKELTKRKLMAKLGLTEVCCPKCGNKLNAEGYNKVCCSGCNYKRNGSNFWSDNVRFRCDPYIIAHGNKGNKDRWNEFKEIK